ncbi:MAG: hypothetical protein ABSC88_02400 [Terracidiphilus sp.]
MLPGLTVSNTQNNFDLELHWVKWLGTIQADSFRESSLYITAVSQSRHNAGTQPSQQTLDEQVRLLHHTLVLLGCGYNEATLMVGGNTSGGSLYIGPVRRGLTPCNRPYYRKHRRIEMVDLERAKVILTNLEHIYGHAPNPLYKRLRKGFNVWIRGTEETLEWSERLHSFVRASEAIIKPTIIVRRRRVPGKNILRTVSRAITATFLSRGQTLIGHSKANERLLNQLYDIRSSVEHTKDIMPVVRKAKGIPSEEAFLFRALQCEILASTIYSRILSNTELMECFSTDKKVEGFWNRTDVKRRSLWGDPIDLEAEARMQFFSHVPREFY